MNVGAAGLFGLLLGVGLILLLELIDHTFKKPEEVEKMLGINVIGTIPAFDGGKRGKKKPRMKKNFKNNTLKILLYIIIQSQPLPRRLESFAQICIIQV